ncbi:hypothetical protein [Pseudovibrio sp. SPO723]|uniref:hypothetical protein n=1 Tax=Nesiotobacter zosterae TaxID=392721 RepID=UPI0029C246B7|nr:hypothetical protein [Pseudovibrio sp. SPO723]MDX5595444.1 hypothetical protein [Pseudovibrio sp. SPO723]
MRFTFSSCLFALAAPCVLAVPAHAAQCITLESVQLSANLDTNEDEGSHIGKHVAGFGIYSDAPADKPTMASTFFEGEDQYDAVKAVFLASGAGDCDETVSTSNVVITLGAADFTADTAPFAGYDCVADGIRTVTNPFATAPRTYCTRVDEASKFTPTNMTFVVKWNADESKWFTLTAYPKR